LVGGGGGGKVHSTCFVLVADFGSSLLSRSCLFSLFFLSWTQAPFVLAIVPAKDITKIKDENDDIKELTTEHKQWRAYLPKHLELLSDAR
jgi:2-C-methyl-D-erythritol 4-phosphate cytidylyltransferase